MSYPIYDEKFDWDQGTRVLKSERKEDWRKLPVGYYQRDPEIAAIIRGILHRLSRQLEK